MSFSKEDLVNQHYSWTNSVIDTIFTGEPSRRLFDRFSGDQVLYIINSFGRSLGNLSLTDGRKLEELITNKLPIGLKSELSVFNWLRSAYGY
jgi:hypothetical protein